MKITVLLFLLSLSPLSFAKEVKFQKKYIKVGDHKIKVEIAETLAQQRQGLMGREKLEKEEGMLFVYKEEQPLRFWMKNTFIPLTIGFFDKNKKLIDIQQMKPVKSLIDLKIPQYESRGAAQYALEMNQGWFRRKKIKKGTHFDFLPPSTQ